MGMKIRRAVGGEFRVLVGNFPYGSYPDHNMPMYQNPPPMRQAVGYQVIQTNSLGGVHAQNINGRLAGAHSPKVAEFTVSDNDFSTGAVDIMLGDYILTSEIDYAIGAALANTATNIAAAISNLSGYRATAAGPLVSVEYDVAVASQVDFKITHYGTIINFTGLTPNLGYMDNGGPGITAPRLI